MRAFTQARQFPRTPFSARIILSVLILAVAAWLVWISQPTKRSVKDTLPSAGLETAVIDVKGHRITVELATTPETQATGLSGRESLPDDHGMLFIFPEAENQVFWMKGMRIPLDMVFLRNGTIIRIVADVPLPGNGPPRIVTSAEPADMVLELNAGAAAAYGLRVGDAINVSNGAARGSVELQNSP